MPIEAALDAAREAGMDLVEVSPNQEVPVCKIVDYGKMRYEAQKKKAAAKKKQKTQELKEIKFRPNIDNHDYMVKAKKIAEFLVIAKPFTGPVPIANRINAASRVVTLASRMVVKARAKPE